MKKILEKMARFMYGRYGSDQLGRFLLYVVMGLLLVSTVVGFFPFLATQIIAWVLRILELVLLVIVICRFLSKKIYQRMAENRKYLAVKKKFVGFFTLRRDMYRDRKTHVYKKCPGCKTILRLPRRPGEHTVKCGKCGHRFQVKVR